MNPSPRSPFVPTVVGENPPFGTPDASHDEILADIAHALQTPLAALYAHLSLTAKKHPRDKHMKVCMALAEDAAGLVKDLVRLARTDSTVRSSTQEKIDVGGLIESIVEYMSVLAASKDIELSAELEPDVHIVGAKKQLEEVFMNLMGNSIKYIDARTTGTNIIRVRVHSTDDACVVQITDTGIGIDADELPHVFTRSYRTRAGSARAPGSGLGLAIAKKTIEAHDGSITIDSVSGKGTCVSCVLPLHEPRLPFSKAVRNDLPVLELDDAIGEPGVLVLVGDHDDGLPMPLVKLLHDLNHRLSRHAVEIGRRLVGKKDVGLLRDSARD
jgi:signal transduction histidine kinase